jgi:hypothetical protein
LTSARRSGQIAYHLADMVSTGHCLSVSTVLRVVSDLARFVAAMCRPRAALAAENLFLRKQMALYIERQAKPRRADDATRIALVALSRLVDWRRLLTIVQPDTLLRWHRTGLRLFWRWKSKPRGRPRVPVLRKMNGPPLVSGMVTTSTCEAGSIVVLIGV